MSDKANLLDIEKMFKVGRKLQDIVVKSAVMQ